MNLVVYLFFNGNCEEAINFYKDTLKGEVLFMQRFVDSPMPCEDADKNKVMHATLKMENFMMMFSDSDSKHEITFGNNYSLSLDFKDAESLDSTFAALAAGGSTEMAPQDMFWGARFAMCTDKFGVKWMFNYDKPKA
ncbi:VOC family protein [Taibaiella soli]|uniref:VOC family protein n=1 Tax=Taibaiella soli TaxID=1649169 RepID=A0A2W2BZF8_9BACT|nr:VOC family protein [Taibaiella soli]PZF73233.1 VOC family protein [Taibaiella soli]